MYASLRSLFIAAHNERQFAVLSYRLYVHTTPCKSDVAKKSRNLQNLPLYGKKSDLQNSAQNIQNAFGEMQKKFTYRNNKDDLTDEAHSPGDAQKTKNENYSKHRGTSRDQYDDSEGFTGRSNFQSSQRAKQKQWEEPRVTDESSFGNEKYSRREPYDKQRRTEEGSFRFRSTNREPFRNNVRHRLNLDQNQEEDRERSPFQESNNQRRSQYVEGRGSEFRSRNYSKREQNFENREPYDKPRGIGEGSFRFRNSTFQKEPFQSNLKGQLNFERPVQNRDDLPSLHFQDSNNQKRRQYVEGKGSEFRSGDLSKRENNFENHVEEEVQQRRMRTISTGRGNEFMDKREFDSEKLNSDEDIENAGRNSFENNDSRPLSEDDFDLNSRGNHKQTKDDSNLMEDKSSPFAKGNQWDYNYGLTGEGKTSREMYATSRVKKEIDVKGELLYGIFPVLLALQAGQRRFHRLFIRKSLAASPSDLVREIVAKCVKLKIPIVNVSKFDLNCLSKARPHQGVCLDTSGLKFEPIESAVDCQPEPSQRPLLWLVLDSIKDPMNFGAVIRSSVYLGVDSLITVAENSCPLTPVVSKASAGTLELIKIKKVFDLVDFLQERANSGWRILGTTAQNTDELEETEDEEMHPENKSRMSESTQIEPQSERPPTITSLSDVRLTQNSIIVIGNECKGLSKEVRNLCHEMISIPHSGHENPHVDSLNVSVATGIILYHLLSSKKTV